ncbi:hypothetical protein [Sandaracinus amylolyticus]|uniref:Uncharacterized protein n=1 Tax=Sandaracinus amylolyticus TaxID=927083 RepID=A0A0F6YMK7_9BACT|nr:hypothetical protein [Sandaracinus amylolyticus]AKF11470.1 hypothetical protein DB32_008619 [Sandaracinus amylolyticus]
MRGKTVVAGIGITFALLGADPAAVHAQLLQRSSDAVRGREPASVVVDGGGSSGGGAASRPPPPDRGGGGGGVVRPPLGGGYDRPDVPDPQPRESPPPQTRERPPHRVWRPWGGTTWTPPVTTTTTTTTTVIVQPPAAEAEPPRDPMYGGSAGVRLVSPIVPPPRAVPDQPPPAGTPQGTLVAVGEEEVVTVRPEVQGVISADAGYVFDDVARVTVSGRVSLPYRIDVLLGYSGYLEPRDAGFDALAIGRLGIGARLIDEEVAQLRIALAVRHFQDWIGPQFGVDAILGVDVDVYESVVLGLEGSFGTIGETFSAQARASLGVRIDSVEIFAGYDHLVLQPFDSSQRAVELGGPMIGVLVVVE